MTSPTATAGTSGDGRIPAVAYLRVSTDSQAEEDRFGLSTQRDQVEAFAAAHGFQVVAWYVDEGISGATLDRPGLRSLLDDVGRLHARAAIVAKLDRISRDLMAQLWIEKELLRTGIELVSATEALRGSDPTAILMRQIIGAFSEFEKARITERFRGGRRSKARTGGYAGGAAPFGYRAERGAKILTVDPSQAETVRRVFVLRADHPEWSLQQLADKLNTEGHTTMQGKPFRRMQVKRILDREAIYLGVYRYTDIEAPGQHDAILPTNRVSSSSKDSNRNNGYKNGRND